MFLYSITVENIFKSPAIFLNKANKTQIYTVITAVYNSFPGALVFKIRKKLLLASQSPRRKCFLEDLGLSFNVEAASIKEVRKKAESPHIFVQRMAHEKAKSISSNNPKYYVLSADTIVYIDDMVFGKPHSEEDAVEMLMFLSGRQHFVMTAYSLCNQDLDIHVVEHSLTQVWFSSFSRDVAHAYVNSGESLDKAGGYGIQGRGGVLVEKISGSYSNVVGLPLAETTALLMRYGVISVS